MMVIKIKQQSTTKYNKVQQSTTKYSRLFVYLLAGLFIISQPMAGASWRENMQSLYGKTPGKKEITELISRNYGVLKGTAIIGAVLLSLWYTSFFKNVWGGKTAEEKALEEKVKKVLASKDVGKIVDLLNELYVGRSWMSFSDFVSVKAHIKREELVTEISKKNSVICTALKSELGIASNNLKKEMGKITVPVEEEPIYQLINVLIKIACEQPKKEEKEIKQQSADQKELEKEVNKLLEKPSDNVEGIIILLDRLYAKNEWTEFSELILQHAKIKKVDGVSQITTLAQFIKEKNADVCTGIRKYFNYSTMNQVANKLLKKLMEALIKIACEK